MPAPSHDLAVVVARVAERLATLAAGAALRCSEPVVGPGDGLVALSRLRALGLDDLDLGLLVTAAAPDLDRRLGSIFAGLPGGPGSRRATAGVTIELNGASPWDASVRDRLGPAGLLARLGLVVVDVEVGALDRSLTVPDRVVAHLLGADAVDTSLEPLLTVPVGAQLAGVEELARALAAGIWTCWVQQRPGGAGLGLATAALARVGLPVFAVDLDRLPEGRRLDHVAVVVRREAALSGAGLVIAGVAGARDRGAFSALADAVVPTVLVGDEPWDPRWAGFVPHVVEAGPAPVAARRQVWADVLEHLGADVSLAVEASTLRLTPEGILGAATVGARAASARVGQMGLDDIRAGARSQNAGRLTTVARRTTPRASFDDLVLPDAMLEDLRSLVGRARDRELVRDTWGMAGGRGVSALLAGPSGTGKTLSAEVVAGALGGDLYTVDLSQVVDKYLGETEKKLERVFTEAEGVNGVLFFDEADALFGKRSGVSDARDRYANVEVAYLLQRVESFEGVLLLATNLHANVDEAFTRRIDLTLRYPPPTEAERMELWRRHLPPTLPIADDVDLALLAAVAEVTGGAIRNAAVTAAFAAARRSGPVTMDDLVRATTREYENMGRLLDTSRFGVAGVR